MWIFAGRGVTLSAGAWIAALTKGVVKAMFFSNMKNAVTLLAVAFVLTSSVGVWRCVVGTGQTKDKCQVLSLPPLQELPKVARAEYDVPKQSVGTRGGKKQDEKPPSRVGQIFIVGNEKTSDEELLKALELFPGQILSFPDLRLAEQRLARIKGLKSNPKLTVLDREGDSVFKDIQIAVDEK
jgi:hypothetical protein